MAKLSKNLLDSVNTLEREECVLFFQFVDGDDFMEENYKGKRANTLRQNIVGMLEAVEEKNLLKLKEELKKENAVLFNKIFDENVKEVSENNEEKSETEEKKDKKRHSLKLVDMTDLQRLESLTANQKLILAKIVKLEKSGSNKNRIDGLTPRNKTPFFTGAIVTTLVEKGIIVVEKDGKKPKTVSITERFKSLLLK